MINFITGMLVGMATVGIIIIIVDQLRTRGYSTNPIDILGGVLLALWDGLNRLAKKAAEWSVKRDMDDEERYVGKHEVSNEARMDAMEEVYEEGVYDDGEEFVEDEDMNFIDLAVAHCEGKVI